MKLRRIFITFCLLITSAPFLYAACPSCATTETPSKTTEPPEVVVSITPFYFLVASIMQGVGTPKLLVQPGASPHHYSLRPSELQQLSHADVIIWGGPQLESFLIKPLESDHLKPSVKLIQLDKTPDLLLLPTRRTAHFEAHEHAHEHAENHEHSHNHNDMDMHFWLNPNNASLMVNHIVDVLSGIDPTHADVYKKNRDTFQQELKTVNNNIALKLKNVQKIPYIVFHDAYQYFDYYYGTNGVGAISLHPEIPISLQRLKEIRGVIDSTKARCVFSEPQFPSPLVQNIISDTAVRTGELNPLGIYTEDKAKGYFLLLENLSNSLYSCLSTKKPKS